MINQIKNNLAILRQAKPVILCITNYVTMDFIANSLLSLGASPIISTSVDEIEELMRISQAVYINIGTLNQKFIELVKFTCIVAKKYKKAIILDPVGVGASIIRTEAVRDILPFIDIIRGNASEIIAIGSQSYKTLGVDSNDKVVDALQTAKAIAGHHNITVMVSGADDFITDVTHQQILSFGSDLMPFVTGMGCSLVAVISAFRAINPISYEATLYAACYFSLVGQLTAISTKAPGSFKTLFIDNLYQPDWCQMRELYERR